MSVNAVPQDPVVALQASQLADRLTAWFASSRIACRPVAVALSGGVDSAVVAKAASLAHPTAVAVTARSESVSAHEQNDAQKLAAAIGIEHHWVEPNEVQDPAYQRNDGRRCFYCKSRLYAAIAGRFPQHQILSGTNFDDLGDYRPGLQAAEKAQVMAPLVELQIGKAAVRQLARHWTLAVADKPASPCLASRIAYGVAVTPERLQRIERAEQLLRDMGWTELRVRLHADDLARIEIPAVELENFLNSSARRIQLVQALKRLGFRYVTLDLEGFRSGNLNQVFEIAKGKPPAQRD